MHRLTTNDTEITAILKLSDNNPEAVYALTCLMDKSLDFYEAEVDLNGIRLLIALDNMKMYGQDIADFYVYSCGENPEMFLYFIRSVIDGKIEQLPYSGDNFWKTIPISGTSAIRSLYKAGDR